MGVSTQHHPCAVTVTLKPTDSLAQGDGQLMHIFFVVAWLPRLILILATVLPKPMEALADQHVAATRFRG